MPLGADDELVNKYNNFHSRLITKQNIGLNFNDFIIVTGGKIDSAKKQILLLMEAVGQLDNVQIKLIVFGSVSNALKKEFDEATTHKNIIYLGWITAEGSYKYFPLLI